MSAIIAYNVSSQQAITATFTELQQQLLTQVTASTGLTWFMENRKEMYTFTKRASNRKFKQEIEAKWLITQTLSTLKKKTDKLVREFFDNPHMKMACTITEAAQELRKWQQSEGRVQSKLRGPQRSPTVDEEEMKVVKKEEFDVLIRLRIETLDEAMR
ncbi:hypothetical protein BDN71DRAFT_1434161 [Pleurotus eryngii]|uniref:Uncharacterized protein n=1 Tax=Pleurotus eryngii TaxID=5323 RepID=A0A9P5ZN75_PLEER|nr:hypothetical protein BDN71DRAFT_1434161 [Pleurotus eryngii]